MDGSLDKKVYRELVRIVLTSVVCCIMIAAGIYGLVLAFSNDNNDTLLGILSCGVFVFVCWAMIDIVRRKKIVLDEHSIYVPCGWRFNDASQQEVDIKYVDIKRISCEDTLDNGATTTNWFMRQYIRTRVVLETENGEQHRICISWYTEKTQVRILDDIIARCATVGNKLDVPCGKELLSNRKK